MGNEERFVTQYRVSVIRWVSSNDLIIPVYRRESESVSRSVPSNSLRPHAL